MLDIRVASLIHRPFALRFLVVLPGLRPELNPRELMSERGLERLSAWMDAVRVRPSCTASLPAEDELVQGYKSLLARMAAMPAPN